MATNRSTIQALERMSELIRELNAWNKVMKAHASMQKKQKEKDGFKTRYVYDDKAGIVRRVKK